MCVCVAGGGVKLCLRGDNSYISDLNVTKQKIHQPQKNVEIFLEMLMQKQRCLFQLL